MDAQPVFALFRHEDGSWYRLWITHSEPKTGRGHRWHLHASYDKTGTLAPVAGTLWHEQPYGMSNWDYDSEGDALEEFRRRAAERFEHGYTLREGAIPPPSPSSADAAAQTSKAA